MKRKLLLHAIQHCPSPCRQAYASEAHTTSGQDCLLALNCQLGSLPRL